MDGGAAGHALQGAALTLVAHRVDCERVVDLTDPMALSAIGITLEMLGSPWEDLSTRGLSPPTWGLAKQLIQAGHHGILVPSFAPGTGEGDRNLVLWRWPAAAPCRVLVIGDFGRLPKADGWLQPFDR
jgi:RES domain-containing protein